MITKLAPDARDARRIVALLAFAGPLPRMRIAHELGIRGDAIYTHIAWLQQLHYIEIGMGAEGVSVYSTTGAWDPDEDVAKASADPHAAREFRDRATAPPQ